MSLLRSSVGAIGRARMAIASIAASYALTVAVGIGMVSTGNTLALYEFLA